jgi:tetratricopeptide (TPR) repeat protein
LADRKLDSATARLNAVILKDQRNVDALMALAMWRSAAATSPRPSAGMKRQRTFPAATTCSRRSHSSIFIFATSSSKQRASPFKRAANKNPDAVTTLLAQARIALLSGDAPGARAGLTRAANASSTNAPLLTQNALMQIEAGHLAGASYTIDKALGQRPDYLPAVALRGDLDIRAGDYTKAAQLARQLVTRFPSSGSVTACKGLGGRARGQIDGAIDAYRRAHEIERKQATV